VPAASLDAFRDRADRFIAKQDEELYLHYSGQKERLELEPIYEEFADLTSLEQAQAVAAAVDGDRGARELWRFACEGYIGNLTRSLAERIAELEATLETTVDGETVPFRMLRPALANEPDRDRRRRLDAALAGLMDEQLNPVYLEAVQVTQDAARALGAASYRDLYVERFGWPLEELASHCRSFLESTERLWEEQADRLFRDRLGLGLAEAKRWDVLRFFKGMKWEQRFPADRLVPALRSTLAGLGIDLDAQSNVHLDTENRPSKDPRAFCAPIEVPDRVMLVIKPVGGPSDWEAFFHEAGHAEHFANTSPDLKMEEKRLGDNAVTEGWAMLLQHLTDEPRWLTRLLDFPSPREYAQEGAIGLLYFVRRYAAKLLYELEFHAAADASALRPRYVELLGDALKIEPSGASYLADIDAGFTVSGYLRSWAFEAQMRDHLRTRHGSEWFASERAGHELLELWSRGQGPTADELLRDATGSGLEMDAIAERIREPL
jgi:hypothetical protein